MKSLENANRVAVDIGKHLFYTMLALAIIAAVAKWEINHYGTCAPSGVTDGVPEPQRGFHYDTSSPIK